MAIEKDKLTIDVELDSKGAIRGLGDLDKGFKKIDSSAKGSSSSISSFDKSLDTAFKSITALNQGIQLAKAAYNTFAGAIKTATDAYAVQEKAQLGLINTLKLQGQFTQAAIKDFTDFANKLQETTTVGDEVTLSFLKTAKAMGLSNDQSKEAVKAAANLSAATGKDLNSAFQQVLKTFSGFAGELGEALPAIKDLTNAQRKAGEAAKLVNQQLGGEAEALANTFGGSNLKRANALGDVLEQIGQTFVEVFDLTAVNKDMTAFFQDMISQVKVFRATLLAVDFKKLQIELEKIGTTLSVVILPVLIRMATPLALVALKFTAIAVAVGAIVVVIDLLVRNMKNLGSVGAVVLDGLKVAWTNFNITVIKGWELIANAGADFFSFLGTFDTAFSKMAKSASKSLSEIGKTLAENLRVQIKKSKIETNDLAKSFEGLDDKGAVGAITEGIKEITRAIETGVVPQVKLFDNQLNKANSTIKKAIALTKEEKNELAKLRSENLKISQEILLQGKTEAEQAALKLQFILNEIEARKSLIDLGSSEADFTARAILDQQKNLTLLREQGGIIIKQKQVFGEISARVADLANQLAVIRGDLETPTDQALIDFIDQNKQIDDLIRNLKSTGIVITDISKLTVLPGMTGDNASKIVSNSIAILAQLEKMRDGFNRIAQATKETSIGEDISSNINSFLRGTSKNIDKFAGKLNISLSNAADRLDASGFTKFANAARGAIKEIPAFDLKISPDTQAGIANFIDNTVSIFSSGFDMIAAAWDGVSSVIGAGADFFSGAADFIMGFDQAGLDALKEMPGKITEGMMNIGPTIAAMGQAFADGAAAFLDGIGAMLDQIGPIMAKLVAQIGDALLGLLDKLPGIVFKFVEAMVPAFNELIKRLPDLVAKIFEAIPEIIDALLSFLPEMLVTMIDALPELITALIDGVISSIGKIITSLIDIFVTKGGALKIAIALVKALLNLVPAIVKGIATGLAKALKSIFSGFSYPLPDIRPFTKSVEDFVKKTVGGAKKIADEIFSVIDIGSDGGKKKSKGNDFPTDIEEALIEQGKKVVSGLNLEDIILASLGLLGLKEAIGLLKTALESLSMAGLMTSIGGLFNLLATLSMDGLMTSIGDLIDLIETFSMSGLLTSLGDLIDILGLDALSMSGLMTSINGLFDLLGTLSMDGLITSLGDLIDLLEIFSMSGLMTSLSDLSSISLDDLSKSVREMTTSVNSIDGSSLSGLDKQIADVEKGLGKLSLSGLETSIKSVTDLLSPLSMDGVITTINNVKTFIMDSLGLFVTSMTTIFDNFKIVIEPIVRTLKSIVDTVKSMVSGLQTMLEGLPEAINKFITSITNFFTVDLPELVKRAFKSASDIFDSLFGIVTRAFTGVFDDLITFSFPALPAFSFPALPAFSFPALPAFSFPELPTLKIDAPQIDGGAIGNAIGDSFKRIATSIDWKKMLGVGGGGGGGGGGTLQKLGSALGFNEGGIVQRFAHGGNVDSVKAMLTPGEFVLKRNAAASLGSNNLETMNRTGQLPKGGNSVAINIASGAIQVNQLPGETGDDVANRVIEEIKRRSVNGETVMFASGIRTA